ncbi:MAG TPA: hypothetical protein VJT31_38335 [Rugosimonospora sp.]|nr:hypothetical protein [Rugosimonospora sp.]
MTVRSRVTVRSREVYRVHWVLGTDVLVGECHCGARREAEDPVELWEWLLAHPVGHRPSLVEAA